MLALLSLIHLPLFSPPTFPSPAPIPGEPPSPVSEPPTGAPAAPARHPSPGAPSISSLDEGLATLRGVLDEVSGLMASGKWKDAQERMRGFLNDPAHSDAIVARWPWIADVLTTSGFWARYEVPDPEEVVPSIVTWKERRGDVKLVYKRGDEGLSAASDGAGDFIPVQGADGEASNFFLHPIRFTGPYRVEVRGSSLAQPPSLFVDWVWGSLKGYGFGTSYLVTVDRGYSRIFSLADARLKIVDHCSTDLLQGRRYSFEVRVNGSSVTFLYNGKKQLKVKRPKGEFGQFGLVGLDAHDEVEIEGEIEPAWIRGLVEARVQSALADYRSTYDPLEDAPAAIRERLSGDTRSARDFGATWPGEPEGETEEVLMKATRLFDEQEFEEGLKWVESLEAGPLGEALDEVLIDWMRTNFLVYTGDTDGAFEVVTRVATAAPEFYEARLLEVWLSRTRVPEGQVRDLYEGLRIDFPEHVEPHEGLALQHLLTGDLEKAEGVLTAAAEAGFPMDALRDIGVTLLRRRDGPSWPDAERFSSRNYTVHSNAGKVTCTRIATELEQCLRAYQRLLGRIESKDEPRFPVYFFAGQAGYQAYCEDLLGTPADNTLGIFHPALKQLLVWDSPNPGSTMRTVRHEGFHQFFDRLVGDSPVWLNEGMAEYYEQARFVDGRWEDDQLNEEHLALLDLTSGNWTPLATFVRQDNQAFRAKSGLHYAQGWAFVHYLCNGGKEPKKIFKRLIEGLKSGLSNEDAVEAAFEGVDLKDLDREFQRYVFRLR